MNYPADNNTSELTQECLSSHVLSGYRSLFYLWSPSETSFAKVEDVPDYVNEVSKIINYEIKVVVLLVRSETAGQLLNSRILL